MITDQELKDRLDDRNISTVAQKIGVSRQTIYNWKSGKTGLSLNNFRKLAAYLFPEGEK